MSRIQVDPAMRAVIAECAVRYPEVLASVVSVPHAPKEFAVGVLRNGVTPRGGLPACGCFLGTMAAFLGVSGTKEIAEVLRMRWETVSDAMVWCITPARDRAACAYAETVFQGMLDAGVTP